MRSARQFAVPTLFSSRVCQDVEILALAFPGRLHQARHALPSTGGLSDHERPTGACPCHALRSL
jgi:hypothetical protein